MTYVSNSSNPMKQLTGEVLTHVDVDDSKNQILLTTESGKTYLLYHPQDCCESVKIEDVDGEWHTLLGKAIEQATWEEDSENDPPEYAESWTRTTLTFRVSDATVICRWIGESNGYYSEVVYLSDITNQPKETGW